MIMCIQIVLQL